MEHYIMPCKVSHAIIDRLICSSSVFLRKFMMRPQTEIKFLDVPPYPDAVTLTERKVKHIQSSEHETSSNPSALARLSLIECKVFDVSLLSLGV